MNMTVDEFRQYLEKLLDDPKLAEITRVINATNAALNALVAYEPRVDTYEFIGDGSTASFSLPDDYYWYAGFFDANGARLTVLWPAESEYILESGEYSVIITPSGQVRFHPLLQLNDKVTLYYYARWPLVTDQNSQIGPAYHWLNALAYYASAELIIADALTAAGVRQFGTRIDSGNPEHNPVARQIEAFRKMFKEEVARHAHMTIKTNG